jgi:hypothetical protein
MTIKIVGSNETGTGVGSVTIADKEKRKHHTKKAFTKPPSRNEALIQGDKNFYRAEGIWRCSWAYQYFLEKR